MPVATRDRNATCCARGFAGLRPTASSLRPEIAVPVKFSLFSHFASARQLPACFIKTMRMWHFRHLSRTESSVLGPVRIGPLSSAFMTFTESAAPKRLPIRGAFRRRILLLFVFLASATGAFPVAAAAAAATGPAHQAVHEWTPAQAPVPGTAAANPVAAPRQVTCAAPGQCVGVGSFNSASGYAAGLIERLRHGSWAATAAPLPSAITGPQKVTLTSVSCPTATSCGVSGFADGASTRRSELLTLRNGRWTAQVAPLLPATLADSQTLSAISCPRRGRCVAVGRYQGGAHGYYGGLIEVQSAAPVACRRGAAARGRDHDRRPVRRCRLGLLPAGRPVHDRRRLRRQRGQPRALR